MERRGIYVETSIRADISAVWQATQDPGEHVRWDVRFTRISPTGVTGDAATTFAYERRVPFHTVRGTGVSIGEKNSLDGTRTSALRFHTTDRVSPIAAGRGYWRYIPDGQVTVFVTGYDYNPGWGAVDVIVRPVLGWATAWSFDRLRIWMETGIPPERWPWWSVFWWWRPDRPRAVRCRRAPAGGSRYTDRLAGAPSSLAALPDPQVTS